MITTPFTIDWRLVPTNTRIIMKKDGYVKAVTTETIFNGNNLIVTYSEINDRTKKNEKITIELSIEDLQECVISNIPDRLYVSSNIKQPTLLEKISAETLKDTTDIEPLTSAELRYATCFQLHKTKDLWVFAHNDIIKIIPIIDFKVTFNPSQIIFLVQSDVIRLDVPNKLLYEAIKNAVLIQSLG